jgi:hypothetical protein
MPITPNPRNDPMHQMRSMVYQMGQEVLTHVFSSFCNENSILPLKQYFLLIMFNTLQLISVSQEYNNLYLKKAHLWWLQRLKCHLQG